MTTYNYLKDRELCVRSIVANSKSFGDFCLRTEKEYNQIWRDWQCGHEYTAAWLQVFYITDGEQV